MPTLADPAADSRRRLLEAAAEVFLAEGYRASVERIAARAGVARQTLYNHFPRKETLFEEVVRTALRSVLVTLEAPDGELRTNLLRFAQAYREKVLAPEGLAVFRNMVAEAPRFPELSRNFFVAGPVRTVEHLAQFLERAMARGQLRREDPRLLAEMLTGALSNHDRLRGLLDDRESPLADAGKAARIVDSFLRAYRPEQGSP